MSGPPPSTTYRFTVTVPVAPASQRKAPTYLWADRRPVPDWVMDADQYVAQRRAKAHAGRTRQAGYLQMLDLDPARCRFTSRSMRLVGEFDAADFQLAVTTVLDVVRWSMWTIYGDRDYEPGGMGERRVPRAALDLRPAARR